MNAFYLRETLAASLVLVAFAGVVIFAMRGCA